MHLLVKMQWWGYLIIAIAIIIGLIALFFISYVLNKRTPVPKGCEDLLINEENCAACNNMDCKLRKAKPAILEENPAEPGSNFKNEENETQKEDK